VASAAVRAQAFPNRLVRVIIGFPAGGPLDQHARLWSEPLAKRLGQPVIVDH
jgi:tripartite-type tricarboxylate transporter receptor subunit TctC